MIALIDAEVLKLRTTRTFAIMAGVTMGLWLVAVVLTGTLEDTSDADDLNQLYTAHFFGFFFLLLAVVGTTGEWRHRTITSSVLSSPDRMRLLGAKVLAYAAAGAALALVATIVVLMVGSVVIDTTSGEGLSSGDNVSIIWRNVVLWALFGALGVGVGAVVRNQVAAVIGLVVLAMVVEPLVLGLVPEVGRYGPTVGAPSAIQQDDFSDEDLLTTGAAIVVMLAWVTAMFAGAVALLNTRDVT